MAIKNKDFVEIEYTGRIKEEGIIFDTTDEKTAKDNNIFSENMKYGPVIICIGESHVIKGLDDSIEGKELGEYEVEISPENAFGKKDAKLVQLIPVRKFIKQEINPVPGLQVNIDGTMGTIKTVSGGRTLVDFNHPLSGKDVIYKFKINKIVTDNKEKVKALVSMMFGQMELKVEEKDGKFMVLFQQDIPQEMKKVIVDKVKELVGVDVEVTKEEKKTEEKPEEKKEEAPKEAETKEEKPAEKKEETQKEATPKEG